MKPAPFEYCAPDSLEEVLSLLTRHGAGAKLLAGGQSLIPTMNFRLAQPAFLIDLNRVSGLDVLEASGGGGVSMGAMVRQRTVERSALVAERAPLLSETMPWVAHPQIRNRGTVGGSLAHADPAAEMPAVMLARQARMRVVGPAGERWISAEEFFVGFFETAVGEGEVLVEVEVPPMPPRSGHSFVEIARRHGDFALVGVAAVVDLDATGAFAAPRVALLSVGDGPVLAENTTDLLRGERPTPELLRAAAETAAEQDVDPPGDIHASAEYRRHLVSVMVRRALETAVARAGSSARGTE